MTKPEIAMFAKAKEIQEAWEPKYGDMVAVESSNHGIEFKGFLCQVDGRAVTQTLTPIGRGVLLSQFPGVHPNDAYIFLPSTEYMAERWANAEGKNRSAWGFLYQVNEFAKSYMRSWPLQIIVLAFLMSDLYGKVWLEKEGEWK